MAHKERYPNGGKEILHGIICNCQDCGCTRPVESRGFQRCSICRSKKCCKQSPHRG